MSTPNVATDAKVYRDIGWKPEEYGFKLIVSGEKGGRTPVWKKWIEGKVFVLIRLSDDLWVLKKELKNIDREGVENIRRLVKIHTVIDEYKYVDVQDAVNQAIFIDMLGRDALRRGESGYYSRLEIEDSGRIVCKLLVRNNEKENYYHKGNK